MNADCKKIREQILDIARVSGHGHIPTCFSIVECIYAVYETMRHRPSESDWLGRDIFILSKGHAALGYYCVLSHFGYFDIEQVYGFGSFGSNFGCHADRHKVPGVELSCGSLGHGIGVAAGAALGAKIKGSDQKIFVLIGDGESNEGTVWEAVMAASDRKLNNLTIIYDNNMSHSRGLQIENPAARFSSFGCEVFQTPGHDIERLKAVFSADSEQVKAVVADTVKGFGSEMLEKNQHAWHRRAPNQQEYEMLMEELNAQTV
jgi:transketolase